MIAIASDHGGFKLKEAIVNYFRENNIEFTDYGTNSEESVNYAPFAYKVGMDIVNKKAEKGILCCGTGIGISISANKVKGIRCVVCSEPYSALLSRQHNDTNMLAFGSRVVGADLALMIVDAWLSGEYEGGRHAKRVQMISDIESKR